MRFSRSIRMAICIWLVWYGECDVFVCLIPRQKKRQQDTLSKKIFSFYTVGRGFYWNGQWKAISDQPGFKQVEQIGTLLSGNKNKFGISDQDEFGCIAFCPQTLTILFRGSVTTQEEIKSL